MKSDVQEKKKKQQQKNEPAIRRASDCASFWKRHSLQFFVGGSSEKHSTMLLLCFGFLCVWFFCVFLCVFFYFLLSAPGLHKMFDKASSWVLVMATVGKQDLRVLSWALPWPANVWGRSSGKHSICKSVLSSAVILTYLVPNRMKLKA